MLAGLATACGGLPTSTGSSAAQAFTPTTDQLHNLQKLNDYRATGKLPALTIDGTLGKFADAGNDALEAGGQPHAHFLAAGDSVFSQGFCGKAAENQAPNWTGGDSTTIIDDALKAMMDEGPGGGHYENIMNGALTRVGIAISTHDGALFFTNDFSASCGN